VVGFISSVIYVYLSSFLLGNVLFRDEVFWHRIVFGFSFFIVLLALGGSVALALYVLTDKIIVLLLFAITSLYNLSYVNLLYHVLRMCYK
jgi:hypothetical protein